MANRYARTGGGNWTDNATWSTTSGGAADTVAPTASDDVFLDANSGNVTISANSVGKSLTCTGYTGTLTHNAFNLLISGNITLVSGMTYTPTNSASCLISMQSNGTFTSGGKTPHIVTLGTNVTMTLGDNLTFDATKTCDLQLNATGAVLVLNGFTVSGNSATNRVLIRTTTLGTARTITNTTGTFANADFRDITFSTVADYSAITGGSGDCGGNTNATFTTSADQHWISASGGNWSDVTKWTSRVPLPQDNVYFDNAFSASQTVTADMPRLGKSIDWTGASGSPTFSLTSSNGVTNYGSFILISAMTFTQSTALYFEGRGSFTITSAGKSFGNNTTINGVGGTYTLSDAFTSTSDLRVGTNCTFNTGGFSISVTQFTTNITGVTSPTLNLGSSTISLTSTGTVFECILSTVNAGTSTIFLTNTSASSKTFSGQGKTFYNLKISGSGAGAVILTGANTFNRIYTDGGGTKSITLPGSTTTTLLSGAGLNNGTNVITFTANSGSATVSKANGILEWDYVNLTNIPSTGGATFYAGANSTDGGGNTGWSFTAYAGGAGTENLTKSGATQIIHTDSEKMLNYWLKQQGWTTTATAPTVPPSLGAI